MTAIFGCERGSQAIALAAILIIQIAAPGQLCNFDRFATWQEIDEQEQGDSSESDSEQGLPQSVAAASHRPQRTIPLAASQHRTSGSSRARKSSRRISMPAEIMHRNGSGGPLRC